MCDAGWGSGEPRESTEPAQREAGGEAEPWPPRASSGPPPLPQDEEQPRQHQGEQETCEPGQPLRRPRKHPKDLGPFALQGSWQRAKGPQDAAGPTFPLAAQSAQALALSGTQAHPFRAHLPLHEHPTSRLTLAGAGQQLALACVSLAPQPHVDGSWFPPSLSVPLLRLAWGPHEHRAAARSHPAPRGA